MEERYFTDFTTIVINNVKITRRVQLECKLLVELPRFLCPKFLCPKNQPAKVSSEKECQKPNKKNLILI